MRNIRSLKDLAATPVFRSQIQDVFFEAMNAGYAAGRPGRISSHSDKLVQRQHDAHLV